MKTNRKVGIWRSGCLVAGVALAMFALGQHNVSAEEECISKEARKNLAHCPGTAY